MNGALRFIEIGNQLTNEMVAGTDYPSEDRLNYPVLSREWLVTIERESVRKNFEVIREQCRIQEKELPRLAEILPGCPPINDNRPSAESFWTGGEGRNRQSFIRDDAAFYRVYRWLNQLTLHFINEGNGDEAAHAWQALLSFSLSGTPGRLSNLSRTKLLNSANQYLYQLLGRTEPGEAALSELQQSISTWHTQLLTLDDVQMDRAWIVQFLREMKEITKDLPTDAMRQVYAKPPKWLPEELQDWASRHGIGSPSKAQMFRMEFQTHLLMMDYLESRVSSGNLDYHHLLDLINDEEPLPGKHFLIFFAPRWNKIIGDIAYLDEDLKCMEALIAAEQYRLKKGYYPKQWSDLVPSLLKEIPSSREKPFILKQVPDGLVIYLQGYKDHGGKVLRIYNPETNEADLDTDHGLMIFYPKYRRQSPPPAKPPKPSDE